MSVFLVAMVRVDDPETYKQYTALTPDTIRAYGGRFVARGGTVDALEGPPFNQRMVILEFPTRERLDEWYNSPEYQEAKKLRVASAESQFLVINGVEDGYAPDAGVVKST